MPTTSTMASESNPMDCGLPPRPPTASTAIWKHLLRTTTTTDAPKSLKDVSIIAPPMAPLDKNATSMRVLLHDTQANFEKFNLQVGKLFETIQETKNELQTMKSLFQHDRETLMGDIVDLVNRSQREIQKSIGTPTQSDAFENLCKNINHRLDGLDQKLEAMNAFNQTHSQALQTQMQTVQLILDKQGSILSAVTPILPFLQGLPPLIEALRTVLAEKMRELSTSLKDHPRSDSSPISPTKRKRTTSVSPSSDDAIKPLGLSQKKSRVMDLSAAQPANGTSPVTDPGQRTSIPLSFNSSSPLLPAPIGTFSRTSSTLQPQETRTVTTQNLTTPHRGRNSFAVPPFPPPTSRRRLNAADLTTSDADHGLSSITSSAVPLLSVATGLASVRARTDVSMHVTAPSPQGNTKAASFFDMTPTAIRPPRMLRVHASIASRSRSNSVVSVAESQAAPTIPIGNTLKDPSLIDSKQELPENQNILQSSTIPGGGKTTTSKLTIAPAVGRITRSSTRALTPLALPRPPQEKPTLVADLKNRITALPRPPQPSANKNKEAVVHNATNKIAAPVALLKENTIRPHVPGNLKGRRSPLKEGRRFIPLIDSDDDEENQ